MSSNQSNSSEAQPPAPPSASGSPRGSVALLVVTLGLLAALVWGSWPARLAFQPAPLRSYPPGCPQRAGDFTPSNLTELRGVSLEGLSAAQRNRVLLRLNMAVCSCGCKASVAECLNDHPACATCQASARRTVDEEKETP